MTQEIRRMNAAMLGQKIPVTAAAEHHVWMKLAAELGPPLR